MNNLLMFLFKNGYKEVESVTEYIANYHYPDELIEYWDGKTWRNFVK